MDITGLIVGLIVGNITGFIIGTIYVVGTVKKNLAKFGKDTMENFFKDAVSMTDPDPPMAVREPVESKRADYIPKHKERKP